jgi:cadmium resistance protein CadD (predicted permease)
MRGRSAFGAACLYAAPGQGAGCGVVPRRFRCREFDPAPLCDGETRTLVNQFLAVLTASVVTFAATNIDDAFLLTFWFARRVPARRIVLGQYLGFAVILLASLIGAWAALAIPHRWVRFLGLLPLAMGLKELFRVHRAEPGPSRNHDNGVASIALVTLSNGADNIGVYVPFFVEARPYLWVILIVYAGMVAIWCAVGRWLGSHSLILKSIERWGHWAAPLVFMGLGISLLIS